MAPYKIRFFLDYGCCFWSSDDRLEIVDDSLLPLTPETHQALREFLREYDACYDVGCPPYRGTTLAYCQEFNRQYRRILDLVGRELFPRYIICNMQLPLTEDQAFLDELERRGTEFYDAQCALYDQSEFEMP